MFSIRILDQQVDGITPREIYKSVLKSVVKKKKSLFFALNIHILVELHKDIVFKRIHERKAKIIFADGVPIVWLSYFFGKKLPGRISGTDFVEKLLKNDNLRIFILGSTKDILKKVSIRYKSVCGYYAPPHNNSWLKNEKNKIIKKINFSGAQIVLVGVGPLKQERWLVDNFATTNVYVGIGVGSAFDILAGRTVRAPGLLKDSGFEWLWRVILEPRRLIGRYTMDFIYLFKIIFL